MQTTNHTQNQSVRVAPLQKLRDRANSPKGFTLVELLIVILIIGILLAIALPTFLSQQDKANDTSAKQDLSTGYKNARADATNQGGGYDSAAAIVSYINAAEPEEDAVAINSVADAQQGKIGVLPNASGGNATFAELSKSGNTCTLKTEDYKLIGPDCQASTAASGGGTDPGSGGAASGPQYLYMGLTSAGPFSSYSILTGDNDGQPLTVYPSPRYLVLGFVQAGLAYATTPSGDLYAINPADGSQTEVTPASSFCGGQGFTNGAITSGGTGRVIGICADVQSIISVKFDGTDAQTLVSAGPDQAFVSVAANSSKIVYEQEEHNYGLNPEVWSANLDGSGKSRVTSVTGSSGLTLNDSGQFAYGIYVSSLSGGGATELTDGSTGLGGDKFSPDGSTIIALAGPNYLTLNAVLIPVGGGSAQQITTQTTTGGASIYGALQLR